MKCCDRPILPLVPNGFPEEEIPEIDLLMNMHISGLYDDGLLHIFPFASQPPPNLPLIISQYPNLHCAIYFAVCSLQWVIAPMKHGDPVCGVAFHFTLIHEVLSDLFRR